MPGPNCNEGVRLAKNGPGPNTDYPLYCICTHLYFALVRPAKNGLKLIIPSMVQNAIQYISLTKTLSKNGMTGLGPSAVASIVLYSSYI